MSLVHCLKLTPGKLIIIDENCYDTFKAVKSDLFKRVKGKYDIIVFNPPYLPVDDEYKDITFDGGKDGRAVIKRFLRNAGKHLKKKGKILLLISSLTGEKEVLALFENNKFKTRVLARQKVPLEELMVIEAGKVR